MSDVDAISALLERYTVALLDRDAQAVIACYADEVVSYDLAPPLAQPAPVTRDPGNLQKWFDTWRGPISTKAHELTIKASGDVGYAFALRHMTGTKKEGEVADLWFRATATFVKKDGAWKIAHVHNSVPFAMDGSGKALLNLKP